MNQLPTDVLATFQALFDEAREVEPDRTAMTVATATSNGVPSARMVLLKHVDERGFVFYSHLDGRKGGELRANPHAALVFYWPRVREGVQVRVEGAVEVIDDAEADAYFASRPRVSQLGAWASPQSRTMPDRADFQARVAQFEEQFAGQDVPRPADWVGFLVRPHAVEFWYAGTYRLHERILHERGTDGTWTQRMLYP